MKEMLNIILEMDKKACAQVDKAQEYRDREIAELSAKKDRVTEEENQRALDSALKKSERQRTEGEAYLKKVSERNRQILKNMNALYEKNADIWVDRIVKSVIGE